LLENDESHDSGRAVRELDRAPREHKPTAYLAQFFLADTGTLYGGQTPEGRGEKPPLRGSADWLVSYLNANYTSPH